MNSDQNSRYRNGSAHGRRALGPSARSYESNGPDVKVRGGAQQVAEKYLQLARDAYTGNDPIAAENLLQHAEHYFRLTAADRAGRPDAAEPGPAE